MFAASSVRGDHANPLFRQLAAQTGTAPKWNFYKYLIGRDGQVVGQWASSTGPQDKPLVAAIEKQLRAR
jgi:glutathione peroxidase